MVPGDLVIYTPNSYSHGEDRKEYLGLIIDSCCPTWVDVFWCELNVVQRLGVNPRLCWKVINETR